MNSWLTTLRRWYWNLRMRRIILVLGQTYDGVDEAVAQREIDEAVRFAREATRARFQDDDPDRQRLTP